jgi:hypothetical protein
LREDVVLTEQHYNIDLHTVGILKRQQKQIL